MSEDTMPVGAMPPEVEEEVVEPEMLLGKFKSQDDLASAYTELEKKFGEQGSDLGNQKQMNSLLTEQLQAREAQAETPATEVEKDAFDFDGQMQQLSDAVEEGDLPIGQALMQASQLSAQNATNTALSKYEELTQQKAVEDAQQRFLQENPDFTELQQTGQLEDIKGQYPGLHDDFSAYYALQAANSKAATEQKEAVQKIAQGDVRTEKVLQKPGSSQVRNIGRTNTKMSDYDIKQSMMAAMG